MWWPMGVWWGWGHCGKVVAKYIGDIGALHGAGTLLATSGWSLGAVRHALAAHGGSSSLPTIRMLLTLTVQEARML